MGVVAILAVLLAGCVPTSSPSPSPSLPSPTPSENAREREERIAYEEAEAVLREFRAEFGRLLNDGGASTPPESLTRLAGGEMLTSAALSLRQAHELGARSIGTARLVLVSAAGYSGASVTIKTCEDGRQVRILQGKKELGRGSVVEATYEVRRGGASWRVWSTTQNEAKSCTG